MDEVRTDIIRVFRSPGDLSSEPVAEVVRSQGSLFLRFATDESVRKLIERVISRDKIEVTLGFPARFYEASASSPEGSDLVLRYIEKLGLGAQLFTMVARSLSSMRGASATRTAGWYPSERVAKNTTAEYADA